MRRIACFAAIAGVCALIAVAPMSAKTANRQSQPDPTTYLASLSVIPAHPFAGQPITLVIRVTNLHGQPVKFAQINGVYPADGIICLLRFKPKSPGVYECAFAPEPPAAGMYEVGATVTIPGRNTTPISVSRYVVVRK